VIALELADLVIIAGRTLGLDTGQVLDLLDPAAAKHALAQARPGREPGDPASQAAALLHALVRHRPLRRGNQQVALAAMLQFLALNDIGTEHLLLAVLREGESVAAQALARLGADHAGVRERVLSLLTSTCEQADRQGQLVDDLAEAAEQLTQVQRQKEAAFDAGDLDSAAALRDREKQLRADKLRLEDQLEPGRHIQAVIAENQQARRELDRLRDLLREHGIEPDGGTARTA